MSFFNYLDQSPTFDPLTDMPEGGKEIFDLIYAAYDTTASFMRPTKNEALFILNNAQPIAVETIMDDIPMMANEEDPFPISKIAIAGFMLGIVDDDNKLSTLELPKFINQAANSLANTMYAVTTAPEGYTWCEFIKSAAARELVIRFCSASRRDERLEKYAYPLPSEALMPAMRNRDACYVLHDVDVVILA
ncbi:hypothetical protein K7432_011160 [Basidiobolus ranarum]|uniref:Uncharacterized protein n=1 Tax=Basidiobolus ranarum TaxID=34480 RepID=A0ABR2WMU0_9FUNG